MTILKSMLSAFLMYSKIPVPQVEWKEENRRYAFCFFPLIGVVIGAFLLLWQCLCRMLAIGNALYACGCVLIPVCVTGGIHLDGFCDVNDAKASYADREKALQIMGDPRVGSFAVIHLVLLLLLQFACFTEITGRMEMLLAASSFAVSRSLSGLAAVTFRSAKKDGTLQSFTKPAYRTITVVVLVAALMACAALMLSWNWRRGAFALGTAALVFIYYRNFSYKRFGGITGDLAGWFLQVCETGMLLAIALLDKCS